MLEKIIIENLRHDYCTLDSEDAYAHYHDYLYKIIDAWLEEMDRLLEDDRMSELELQMLGHWTQRFLNTIRVLRMKYLYHSQHLPMMSIDMSSSSFPNLDEISKMEAQKKLCKKQLEMARPRLDILDDMLYELIQGKDVSRQILEEMCSLQYYQLLEESETISAFLPGELVELRTKKGKRDYLITWSYYDVQLNRPVVCFMTFAYHNGGAIMQQSHKNKLWEALSNKDRRTIPLKTVAEYVDQEVDYIRPMIVKRIDLGPILGKYSRDTDPLTSFVQEYENELIVQCTIEVIRSKGQKELIVAGKKRVIQEFKVPIRKYEEVISKTTERHKYFFCSHKMAQLLSEKKEFDSTMRSLALSPITFSNKLLTSKSRQ